MKFPRTNHSNQRLTTSKLRFLCDGTGDVYVKCYFSQLSSTSSTLLGPWKPYPGGIDHSFRPSLDPSRRNKYRHTTTVQLLTKKRSIVLSFVLSFNAEGLWRRSLMWKFFDQSIGSPKPSAKAETKDQWNTPSLRRGLSFQ